MLRADRSELCHGMRCSEVQTRRHSRNGTQLRRDRSRNRIMVATEAVRLADLADRPGWRPPAQPPDGGELVRSKLPAVTAAGPAAAPVGPACPAGPAGPAGPSAPCSARSSRDTPRLAVRSWPAAHVRGRCRGKRSRARAQSPGRRLLAVPDARNSSPTPPTTTERELIPDWLTTYQAY